MGKCLYCYKKLREGDRDFHPACSQKIFGTKVPPQSTNSSYQVETMLEDW